MGRYQQNVKLYLSSHSFGDLMLIPYGFSENGSPGYTEHWRHHQMVAQLWVDAIRAKTGKIYEVGNSLDLMGTTFGISKDHMHGHFKIPVAFTLELVRGGLSGFDIPEAEIRALREETFWGFRAYGLYVSQNY